MQLSMINFNNYGTNISFGNNIQDIKDEYQSKQKELRQSELGVQRAMDKYTKMDQMLAEVNADKEEVLKEMDAAKIDADLRRTQIINEQKEKCKACEKDIINSLKPLGIIDHAQGWIGYNTKITDGIQQNINDKFRSIDKDFKKTWAAHNSLILKEFRDGQFWPEYHPHEAYIKNENGRYEFIDGTYVYKRAKSVYDNSGFEKV